MIDVDKELSWLESEAPYIDYDTCHLIRLLGEERDGLMAENEKLKSLLSEVANMLFALDVDYCALCKRDQVNHPCPAYTTVGGRCLYETDMRDLGIEVDW